MARRPFRSDDRYRTISELRIIDMLVAHGWRFDVVEGRRRAAQAAAASALEGLIVDGLPFVRAVDGARLFDPVEVLNRLTWAALAGPGSTFEDRFVSAARRECWEGRAGARDLSRPPPLEQAPPQAFRVTIRRTFNLAGAGLRPGERARLRLPAPVADAAIDDLVVEALPPPDVPAQAAFGPARLDIIVVVPECGEITAGVAAGFTARATAAARPGGLDRIDAELFTRPAEGLIRLSPRVAALAERLAAGAADPQTVVRRLWDFMIEAFACGGLHYDALGPHPLHHALDAGWYDCRVGSALLVSLCRARGIPARLVNGYLLHEAAPAFHTWAEAWIEDAGWLPLDLQAWELSVGGRDLAWRDHYFGRLDERLVVERPPRLFGGTGAVRLSRPWQMLTAMTDRGSRINFEDLDTGALVYREEIEVERRPVRCKLEASPPDLG
jgi:hypothetical protein